LTEASRVGDGADAANNPPCRRSTGTIPLSTSTASVVLALDERGSGTFRMPCRMTVSQLQHFRESGRGDIRAQIHFGRRSGNRPCAQSSRLCPDDGPRSDHLFAEWLYCNRIAGSRTPRAACGVASREVAGSASSCTDGVRSKIRPMRLARIIPVRRHQESEVLVRPTRTRDLGRVAATSIGRRCRCRRERGAQGRGVRE